jgi:hypothetical protein
MNKVGTIRSFDRFSQSLERRAHIDLRSVAVQPEWRPVEPGPEWRSLEWLLRTSRGATMERLGEFTCGILYTTHDNIERRRQYREPVVTVFQGEYGIYDEEMKLSVFLAAALRVEQLRLRLSGTGRYLSPELTPLPEVYLAGPSNLKPLSDGAVVELHERSQVLGVSTPDFIV